MSTKKSLVAALDESLNATSLPASLEEPEGQNITTHDRFMVRIANDPPTYFSFTAKNIQTGEYEPELFIQLPMRGGGRTREVPITCWIQRYDENLKETVPIVRVDQISNKHGVRDLLRTQYKKWLAERIKEEPAPQPEEDYSPEIG